MKSLSSSPLLKEVESTIAKLPRSKWGAEVLRGYMNTELDLYGITLPNQRRLLKKGYASTEGLSFEEQAPHWFFVWQTSRSMEVMSQAIFFFEMWTLARKKEAARRDAGRKSQMQKGEGVFDPIRPYLLAMVDRCENWAHSDGLSGLISGAIDEDQAKLFALMQKWNRDRYPWRRRQSIVSLYFYSRFRKKPLPVAKALPLIRNLLKDEHFYVQRGVGWALRECYNVDAAKTLMFLDRHIVDISPTAYYAATEKLSSKHKASLKAKRLAAREKARATRKAAKTKPASRQPSKRTSKKN